MRDPRSRLLFVSAGCFKGNASQTVDHCWGIRNLAQIVVPVLVELLDHV
jgi:hypothetical protein